MTVQTATVKGNWIQAATLAYIKQIHPEVWEEAQQAARDKWSEEHPEDPWKGRREVREAIRWTKPAQTGGSPATS